MKSSAADFESIGPLVEPARRRLYQFVAAEPAAVSREQAAAGVGLPLHAAKFHLDKLVAAGLLEVEYRRLSGRSGPGAGRPTKLYRQSSRQLSVSMPPRQYQLVGSVLASAVDRALGLGPSVQDAVAEAAVAEGRRIAGEAPEAPATTVGPGLAKVEGQVERLRATLVDCGYEPRRRDADIVLTNCPFDSLAKEHTELVCGMNLSLLTGVIEGLSCTRLAARLEPEESLCCVKVGPAPTATR